MDAKALTISKLLQSNWGVFVPVSGGRIFIVYRPDVGCKFCVALSASSSPNRASVGRVPTSGLESFVDYIAYGDTVSERAWLIPAQDISSFQAVRLGKRYDCYELAVVSRVESEDDAALKASSAKIAQELKDSLRTREG